MKKFYLLALVLCTAFAANAQDDHYTPRVGQGPGVTRGEDNATVVNLLPSNVTSTVGTDRKQDKQKNLTVAGSPEKGYKAYFTAQDDEHGEELWCTDGTAEGTYLVKDIVPGSGSSNPTYISRLNDKVLFGAYSNETNSQQLWISDGTEDGTYLLKELYTWGDADPKGFTQMDETRAIFIAIDDESAEYDPDAVQYWLWITDGTEEGTHRVVDEEYLYDYGEDYYIEHQGNCKHPGASNMCLHTAYCRVGRRVFFKADSCDSMTGEELWVTDGTADGTYMVMDVNWVPAGSVDGQTGGSNPDEMANYQNERLFYGCYSFTFGREPWSSDGYKSEANTEQKEQDQGYGGDDHTYLIFDGHSGTDPDTGEGYLGDVFASGFEVYDGRIWFRGYQDDIGFEFNGTNCERGDYQYYDIWTTAPSYDNNSYSDPGCVFDNVYLFCASTGFDADDPNCYGGELWFYDQSDKAVHFQGDFVPGVGCDWVKEQTVASGTLYWYNEDNTMWDEGYGFGLCRLDGIDEKAVTCNLIDPSNANGDQCHTLRNLDGQILYCSATNPGLYTYTYVKPGWDGVTDKGAPMEPDFDTPGESTAIQSVSNEASVKEAQKGVYSLSGVKVKESASGLQKGVYIVDGVKKVVK